MFEGLDDVELLMALEEALHDKVRALSVEQRQAFLEEAMKSAREGRDFDDDGSDGAVGSRVS